MSDALYLYGFVASASPNPPEGLLGIAGRRVEILDLGKVRAAVSSVERLVNTGVSLQVQPPVIVELPSIVCGIM